MWMHLHCKCQYPKQFQFHLNSLSCFNQISIPFNHFLLFFLLIFLQHSFNLFDALFTARTREWIFFRWRWWLTTCRQWRRWTSISASFSIWTIWSRSTIETSFTTVVTEIAIATISPTIATTIPTISTTIFEISEIIWSIELTHSVIIAARAIVWATPTATIIRAAKWTWSRSRTWIGSSWIGARTTTTIAARSWRTWSRTTATASSAATSTATVRATSTICWWLWWFIGNIGRSSETAEFIEHRWTRHYCRRWLRCRRTLGCFVAWTGRCACVRRWRILSIGWFSMRTTFTCTMIGIGLIVHRKCVLFWNRHFFLAILSEHHFPFAVTCLWLCACCSGRLLFSKREKKNNGKFHQTIRKGSNRKFFTHSSLSWFNVFSTFSISDNFLAFISKSGNLVKILQMNGMN